MAKHIHLESHEHVITMGKVQISDFDLKYVTRGIKKRMYIGGLRPPLSSNKR